MAKRKLHDILKYSVLALAGLTGCDGVYRNGERIDIADSEQEDVYVTQSLSPVVDREDVYVVQNPVADAEDEIVEENVAPRAPQARTDYRTNDFSDDSDEVLLARMLYGEARNCSREEQVAIGYVARNRQAIGRYGGGTLRGVILRPSQFSCFNRNDPNRAVIMNPNTREFEPFVETARGVLNGQYGDDTRGATHYFNPRSANPSWAQRMTQIGRVNGSRHVFYREN